MANYFRKKISSTPYPLATVHPLQTDRQTVRQTTTMTIVRPLLEYGRLKILNQHIIFYSKIA